MSIVVNDRKVRAAIKSLTTKLGSTRKVLQVIGNVIKEDIKTAIRTSGANRGRPFAPLSKWTRNKTGRTRPFITLLPHFHYRTTDEKVEIYFENPHGESYDIDQHQHGFTVPSRQRPGNLVYKIYQGSLGSIITAKTKEARIPRRQIFTPREKVRQIVYHEVSKWVRNV